MKRVRFWRIAAILILLGLYGAAAWHSLEEVHYLKSFFPSRFTVRDACFAAWVEVAKLAILGLPLGLAVLVLVLWPGRER